MALLKYESKVREPLVDGDKTYSKVTEDICRPVEAAPSRLWWIGFIIIMLFEILYELDQLDKRRRFKK